MKNFSVGELLQALRNALASLEGLQEFHRLGARQEAMVHARISQRRAVRARGAN